MSGRAQKVVRYLSVVVLLAALITGLRYVTHTRPRTRNAILLAPLAGPESQAAPLTEKLAAALAETVRGTLVVRRLKAPITEEQGEAARAHPATGSLRRWSPGDT